MECNRTRVWLKAALVMGCIGMTSPARADEDGRSVLSSWTGHIADVQGARVGPVQVVRPPATARDVVLSSWSGLIPSAPAAAHAVETVAERRDGSAVLSSWAGVIPAASEPVGAAAGEPSRGAREMR